MLMIIHAICISVISVVIHLAVMEFIYTFYGIPENMFLDAPKWLQNVCKPLFYCPTCMASFWGTTLHFSLGGDVISWIPVVFAVAFLNTIFAKWVSN